MTEQVGLMAYIFVFVFVFFAGSSMLARLANKSPTEPINFTMLVGVSLIWPITLPLAVVIFLLFGIARLAENMSGR